MFHQTTHFVSKCTGKTTTVGKEIVRKRNGVWNASDAIQSLHPQLAMAVMITMVETMNIVKRVTKCGCKVADPTRETHAFN